MLFQNVGIISRIKGALCSLIFLRMLFFADALSIEDIKNIFGKNPCLQGSLTSISNSKVQVDEQMYTIETRGDEVLFDKEDSKGALSQIDELAKYNDIDYFYKLQNEEGPAHQKVFTIKLFLGDEKYSGIGKSLKNAQNQAANQAIQSTKYEFPPAKDNNEINHLTPTVLLNNFASQVGLSVEYFLLMNEIEVSLNPDLPPEKLVRKSYLQKLNESVYSNSSLRYKKDDSQTKGPFHVKLMFDGEKFIGTDHTVQGAKHQAAKKALKRAVKLIEEGNMSCIQGHTKDCKEAKENVKSAISKIYEAAEKRNLEVSFEIVKEFGPSHKKTFVTECRVGDFISTGEGKSKKESKAIAAQNMLENVQNFPQVNSESVVGSYLEKTTKNKSKRNKKKKIIKNTFDKIGRIIDNVLEYGSSIAGAKDSHGKLEKKSGDHKPKNNRHTKSPQNEMLELSNTLNLEIQFTDFDQNSKRYSVLTLHLKPSYICFGEGDSHKTSRDKAAQRGINLIRNLGLLDKLSLAETEQAEDATLNGDSKVWIAFTEETE